MSFPACPQCQSEFVYQDQNHLICPECAYEWSPEEEAAEKALRAVKDVNGAVLEEGDKVTVIKDLKVKGSSTVIKIGSKAVIRRIIEGKDHQLDCRVDGVGEMMVTSIYVKKA